jgi:hypothetical protein
MDYWIGGLMDEWALKCGMGIMGSMGRMGGQ